MKLYKLLENLPSVPDEFVNQALLLENSDKTDISGYQHMMPGFQDRVLIKNDQSQISARSRRYELGSKFQQWIKSTIIDDYSTASVSFTRATSTCWGPHTDITSKFNLIYVLKPGGDQCATHWWYQKDQEPTHLPPPGYFVLDYNELVEIDHVQMIPHKWYCIDQRYLHSVENLSDTRIALHVRLKGEVEL
jgi:hypothetical protein